MLDSNDFIKTIKKMVLETLENTKPCDYVFGEVTKLDPITVKIEQNLTLSGNALLIPNSLTDYTVKVSVEVEVEETSTNITLKEEIDEEATLHTHELEEEAHTHKIEGQKEIIIHNSLKIGEKVILIRQKGGQKFLILDRVITNDT